jgi:peptidoglycan/LPS O-acetylase OafA/YrhL
MRPMWIRRLLSAIVAAILAAAMAVLDLDGYLLLFAFSLAVLIAMLAGLAGEAWLKDRHRVVRARRRV